MMTVDHWCRKLATCLFALCVLAPTGSIASGVMSLEVDTANGQITWINQTGAPIDVDYYEITSVQSALHATDWDSLQEQDLPDFPAGDGIGNGWEVAGGVSAKVLSESFPLGQSTVLSPATISLGAAFNLGGTHDLVFRYGVVPPSPVGDYNDNHVVDAADYTVWRNHWGQSYVMPNDSTPGAIGTEDYSEWKSHFGLVGDSAPPSILVTGIVNYLPLGSASIVPEPSSALLLELGLASLLMKGGRREREHGVIVAIGEAAQWFERVSNRAVATDFERANSHS